MKDVEKFCKYVQNHKKLDFFLCIGYNLICFADVVELADMPDLGSVLYVILLLITVLAVFIDED